MLVLGFGAAEEDTETDSALLHSQMVQAPRCTMSGNNSNNNNKHNDYEYMKQAVTFVTLN